LPSLVVNNYLSSVLNYKANVTILLDWSRGL